MVHEEIIKFIKCLSQSQRQALMKYTYNLNYNDGEVKTLKDDIKAICQEDCFNVLVEFFAQVNEIYRSSNKSDIFAVMDELKVPKEIQELYSPKALAVLFKPNHIPVKIVWRIDTRVSNINTILIRISKGNECDLCIRLDVASFHKLRFNISLILKEIFAMKRRYNKN